MHYIEGQFRPESLSKRRQRRKLENRTRLNGIYVRSGLLEIYQKINDMAMAGMPALSCVNVAGNKMCGCVQYLVILCYGPLMVLASRIRKVTIEFCQCICDIRSPNLIRFQERSSPSKRRPGPNFVTTSKYRWR